MKLDIHDPVIVNAIMMHSYTRVHDSLTNKMSLIAQHAPVRIENINYSKTYNCDAFDVSIGIPNLVNTKSVYHRKHFYQKPIDMISEHYTSTNYS